MSASHAAHGHAEDMRRVLERLAAGEIAVDEAVLKLRLFQVAQIGDFARLDTNRDIRKGVPEIVYASRKKAPELEAIMRRCLADRGFALATRLSPEAAACLKDALTADNGGVDGLTFEHNENAGTLAVHSGAYRSPEKAGVVGLLTAGTSDVPVAEEAALIVSHMGCRVERGYDVGVAGLHRLLEPLSRMLEAGVDALIVVAGMEGALPSVVAGLVDVPVIGVPTSTGYGLGGDGTAALYSILQSCSPGLVAVNIDNGVGAGAAAALIARGRRAEKASG
jgi:pyridinium-3,5-biscarboxylic acid mononucleotide synthase